MLVRGFDRYHHLLHSLMFIGAIALTGVSSAYADFDNFHTIGASNTSGVGAKVPLDARIRNHFSKLEDDRLKSLLEQKKNFSRHRLFFPF